MKFLRLIGVSLPLLLWHGAGAMAQDAAKTDAAKTDAAKPDAAKPLAPVSITLLTKDTVVAADGSFVQTVHVEERAGNDAAAPAISQASIAYDTETQDVTVVDAHTLKADGSSVKVEPSAIYEKLAQGQDGQEVTSLRSKVIVFPQLSGGDSIVYTVRLTAHKSSFPGQFSYGNIFSRILTVNEARETVTVPKSMTMAVENHEVEFSKKDDGDNTVYSWHFSQPVPLAEEPVTYTPLAHKPHFFVSSFKDYAAMGRAYAALTQDKRVVTPKVSALADQLTTGISDRKEQARKLYEWVSGHIRYVAIELGQGSLIPHDVDVTLANGYGDCKDHDILLQSLLQAKGIAAQSVLINGSDSYEMPAVASLATLNHVITYVPEFKIYLDSTAKVAPFGVLPLNEYGKAIVTVSAKEAGLGTMPLLAPGIGKVSFKSDAAVDKDGVVTGTATTTASGPFSIALRAIGLGIEAAGPEAGTKILATQGLKDGTGSFTQGAPADLAPDYSISGSFKFGGWDKEVAGNTRFYMPGVFRILELPGASAMGPINPGKLKDDEPTLCVSTDEIDDMSLKAPPGFAFGEVPKDLKVETPNLLYTTHYTLTGDTMSVHRQFTSKIDQLFCSGDVRKRAVAALKEISDSYDGNLWFKPAPDAASAPGKPADTATAMAAPVKADPALEIFKTALASFNAGQYDQAVKQYGQYLALRPDVAAGYYNRGLAYGKLDQTAQAAADFAQAVKLKPDLDEAWMASGANHRLTQQYDYAVADYSRAIALKPDDALAWQGRGSNNIMAAHYDLAVKDMTEAIRLAPEEANNYFDRGLAYSDMKQFVPAIADYDKTIALDPNYMGAYSNRGEARINTGQYALGISDFDKFLAQKPDDPFSLNDRGFAYRNLAQYDKAMADLNRATALRPDYALPWHNRGIVYLAQKQYDSALTEFDQAIKLDGKYHWSYEQRGIVYRHLNRFDDAIADESHALALQPDDQVAILERAEAYLGAGQPDQAITDCNSLIALKPDSAGAYLLRGLAEQKLGKHYEANLDTGKATSLDPKLIK